MNALNLERCRCIPKNVPGADWRVLQELVAEDPSRELFQVWCSMFSQQSGSSKVLRNLTSKLWHGVVP